MRITNVGNRIFNGWTIRIMEFENCLYSTIAYKKVNDILKVIKHNKIYVTSEDAVLGIINQLMEFKYAKRD